MSDCALLGAGPAPSGAVGAALTASVSTGGFAGEGDSGAGIARRAAATSPTPPRAARCSAAAGRATGCGSWRPAAEGDVLYVLVEDRGPQPIAGIDRRSGAPSSRSTAA